MKLATNMREMKQNFRLNDKFLSEVDQDVYVELFSSQMRRLALDIEDSQINYDTFYITGQSGNGKSTALNHLKNTNNFIKDNFETKHMMANELFDFKDKVTIVDILLMVAMEIIELNDNLKDTYIEKLEDLKKQSLKNYQEVATTTKEEENKTDKKLSSQVDIGFLEAFKFKVGFAKEWNSSEKTRIEFRILFDLDRRKLLDLLNEIIKDYNNQKEVKKLLLIIDDLEKQNISSELFTTHIELLEKIELVKIVVIPVNNVIKNAKVYKLNLRINHNPTIKQNADTLKKDEKVLEDNTNILKDVIYSRIDDKYKNILPNTDDVIGKIIKYSGCNIRQLLRLVAEASANARYNDADTITSLDVDEAIQDLLNTIAIGIHDRESFLKHINTHNKPKEGENEKFTMSISDNMIFAYFNGTPWYEINPILKKYFDT
jgi:hypothetical protein